ncbi:MAG TPA: 2'-deoxycytidine 5'-triphosphate deaminase [Alphaproteobacteria bacterium]|nr:2'-deoxycytidine 5'-triphosphate deaminase [Alphaproteobacteria bacterium]
MAGVLVDAELKKLLATGGITTLRDAEPGQIQPASIDLRLGPKAYRVQASMLPGPRGKVMERIEDLIMGEMDLTQPQLFERGAVYVVPLQEGLKLPKGVDGTCSPKSSTGRLDIFVRVLTDDTSIYDTVADGYKGPLYLEISPLTFPIMARMGDKMTQLRLRSGDVRVTDAELMVLHEKNPLLFGLREPDEVAHMSSGLWVSIDLTRKDDGAGDNPIVGYRAKRHTQPIDLAKIGQYSWRRFWEPITVADCNPLILYPEEFYIFVSREHLCVPPGYSAEMVAYDTRIGELRVHYAGFFDPGWGVTGDKHHGTPAVLEVRAHDVPCVLKDGQRIGRFIYEKLSGEPDALYGSGIGSNYAGQRLKLAKQFKMD